MFWMSFACVVAGYSLALFAGEMPVKLLSLVFGIPGVILAIVGINRAKEDSLIGIVLLSLNAVLALCSFLLGIFFAWVFIAGGPSVI